MAHAARGGRGPSRLAHRCRRARACPGLDGRCSAACRLVSSTTPSARPRRAGDDSRREHGRPAAALLRRLGLGQARDRGRGRATRSTAGPRSALLGLVGRRGSRPGRSEQIGRRHGDRARRDRRRAVLEAHRRRRRTRRAIGASTRRDYRSARSGPAGWRCATPRTSTRVRRSSWDPAGSRASPPRSEACRTASSTTAGGRSSWFHPRSKSEPRACRIWEQARRHR